MIQRLEQFIPGANTLSTITDLEPKPDLHPNFDLRVAAEPFHMDNQYRRENLNADLLLRVVYLELVCIWSCLFLPCAAPSEDGSPDAYS